MTEDPAGRRGISTSEWGLLVFLSQALTWAGPAAPDVRCMGRGCGRKAVVEVRPIDETAGAHQHPARLCSRCGAEDVDIFRWLSNNRIEADR